jgi:hypothetical protein
MSGALHNPERAMRSSAEKEVEVAPASLLEADIIGA